MTSGRLVVRSMILIPRPTNRAVKIGTVEVLALVVMNNFMQALVVLNNSKVW